jgi:hypothetical protein
MLAYSPVTVKLDSTRYIPLTPDSGVPQPARFMQLVGAVAGAAPYPETVGSSTRDMSHQLTYKPGLTQGC